MTAGSASGTSHASRPSRTAAGSTRRAAGRQQTATGHARAGTSPKSSAQTATAAGALSASGQPPATDPGHRTSTTPPRPTTTTGPIGRFVNALPTAVLWALLAFAVIAAAMALNAYLQSRRARSLAGQREALLSDVGVLQAALLPSVPGSLGELDVSVAYRPAQGLAAGGDFFDVFSVAPERTGIIIGDVSGHGRESLIHAALVRYTLRALMGEGHPLPEVLARADRYLRGELGDGFATVIICCYDHTTAELTWAKAGHEPPIIAGQPEPEEEPATPLGLGLGDTLAAVLAIAGPRRASMPVHRRAHRSSPPGRLPRTRTPEVAGRAGAERASAPRSDPDGRRRLHGRPGRRRPEPRDRRRRPADERRADERRAATDVRQAATV